MKTMCQAMFRPGTRSRIYPPFPEKCGDVEPDPKCLPMSGNPYCTVVSLPMISRASRAPVCPQGGFLRGETWVLGLCPHKRPLDASRCHR